MNPYKGLKLGLEFWLPLPLLGLAFWVGGGSIVDEILTRSSPTANHLKVETRSQKQRRTIILFIKAVIDKRQGVSRVEVKIRDNALKKLEFQFPVTELSQVEAAISQELGLPAEDVRKLIQYQTIDR